jgi:hypothetical protein
MIASKCSRQSECRSNDGTQDQGSGDGECYLSDRQRHTAGSDGKKGRPEQAGAIVEGPGTGIDRHKNGKA